MRPVIEAKDLGIEFYRSRRRKMSLREIVFKGKNTAPKDTFWALRNISFSVAPGEAVGLVGGNGSGKSTLLKMIAGVMIPDEGGVKVRGGVAPLIELTGAMVPYAFGISDGLFNLGSALSFAQAPPPGVYVAMNGRCFAWDDVVKNRELGIFEPRRA